MLDDRTPFTPHLRLIHVPLQAPVLAAAFFTDDLLVLRTLFGLTYTAVPFLALLASWWIVRKHAPFLFVWPALAISFATIPGQFAFISEALMASHLCWPIILALLTPITKMQMICVTGVVILVFFAHPFAIGIFAYCAFICFLSQLFDRKKRSNMLTLLVAFLSLSLIRLSMLEVGYESEQITWKTIEGSFFYSVYGLPLLSILLAWLSALLLFLLPIPHKASTHRWLAIIRCSQLITLLASGWLLLFWASSIGSLFLTLVFRFWVLACSLPYLLLTTVEAFRYGPHVNVELKNSWSERIKVIHISSVVFLLVVSAQSVLWSNLTERLERTMMESQHTCISRGSIDWLQRTPLDHWSVTSYSIVLQRKEPRVLVLSEDWCADARLAEKVRLTDWQVREVRSGWFDLGRSRAREKASGGCWFVVSSGLRWAPRRGADWWRWVAGDGRVRLFVESDDSATVRGELDASQRPKKVDVLVNGHVHGTVNLASSGVEPFELQSLPVNVGENAIEFRSTEPTSTGPNSGWLAIAVKDLMLTGAHSTACELQP
jgi:hypothetical protein